MIVVNKHAGPQPGLQFALVLHALHAIAPIQAGPANLKDSVHASLHMY